MFQLVDPRTSPVTLIAEAHTITGIGHAHRIAAEEFRCHPSHLEVRFPADFVLPIAGGGTRTARELGLPLSDAS